jgi:hypothetical protein
MFRRIILCCILIWIDKRQLARWKKRITAVLLSRYRVDFNIAKISLNNGRLSIACLFFSDYRHEYTLEAASISINISRIQLTLLATRLFIRVYLYRLFDKNANVMTALLPYLLHVLPGDQLEIDGLRCKKKTNFDMHLHEMKIERQRTSRQSLQTSRMVFYIDIEELYAKSLADNRLNGVTFRTTMTREMPNRSANEKQHFLCESHINDLAIQWRLDLSTTGQRTHLDVHADAVDFPSIANLVGSPGKKKTIARHCSGTASAGISLDFETRNFTNCRFSGNLDISSLKTSEPLLFARFFRATLFLKMRQREVVNICALDTMPALLPRIVKMAEDPRFNKHNGFDPVYFSYAMAENISHKKMLRGGSTITMQLARNLFLNHEKNIARKVEEIGWSVLMESIPGWEKKRILESYLNIIEWGLGIYGIEKAANYYFAKPASALSILESIVLAYIIPRPKYFADALLERSEQLRTNLALFIKRMSDRLEKKGLLDESCKKSYSQPITFAHPFGILKF